VAAEQSAEVDRKRWEASFQTLTSKAKKIKIKVLKNGQLT
jgi:hypothetical protein